MTTAPTSPGPDPPTVKISETCWCGADVTVEGAPWADATGYVSTWRRHQHRPGREVDAVGFAAGQLSSLPDGALNGARVVR